jgi:D-alanyl-lipoteichoic acid acyltransferase DltB (MBOAT superfamily)
LITLALVQIGIIIASVFFKIKKLIAPFKISRLSFKAIDYLINFLHRLNKLDYENKKSISVRSKLD